METFQITFFGTRGSSATSSQNERKYGNNTSCALVQAGRRFIILDMGTGLIQLAKQIKGQGADVLLSHFHYDHIEGMPYFTPFFSDAPFTIYGEERNQVGVEQLFFNFMKRPYFPITPRMFSQNLSYHTLVENQHFNLGADILVETMHTNHPDFSTAFKIHFDQKSLVYLLDHEHGVLDDEIADFCCGADLVVYDGYFTTEEYESGRYNSWGHSTYAAGLALAQRAGIKRLVLSHHAIWRTDEALDQIGKQVATTFPQAIMGAEGLVVVL